MPFVLKHKETSQILTATLENKYGLSYYGTVQWMDDKEAEEKAQEVLQQLHMSGEEKKNWILVEVKESDLKLFNVKLNNNPQKKLFLDENGKSFTQ